MSRSGALPVFLALWVVACAACTSTLHGSLNSSRETYRDEELGIELRLPDGWQRATRLKPGLAEWLAIHHHGEDPSVDVFARKQYMLKLWRMSFSHESGAGTFFSAGTSTEPSEDLIKKLGASLEDNSPGAAWDGEIAEQLIAGHLFSVMRLLDVETHEVIAMYHFIRNDDEYLVCHSRELSGKPEVVSDLLVGLSFLDD